ncbi:MAG TPA: type II secretion system protein [Candidatus Saccharimonadales bacterium]|nr:type II secretion system protein [Candidatus Saccharimonadales bacterium]
MQYQNGTARLKNGKNTGFTIVEVLIVLAVTGILFVSAATLISGRTNKTQFQQAINDATAQIRQTLNEVSTGYYANLGNFKCQNISNTLTITSGSATQGSNSGCVFLGKVMQFGVKNTDPQQYNTFAVAGLQQDSTGNEITTYTDAKPAVIYPSTAQPNSPNSSITGKWQYGLKVSKMYYNGNEANSVGAVAFLSTLGAYSGTDLQSGAQKITVVPITNTALNDTIANEANVINSNLVSSSAISLTNGVQICFDSGTTNQSGLVTIAGNGQQFSVTLSIKGNTGC